MEEVPAEERVRGILPPASKEACEVCKFSLFYFTASVQRLSVTLALSSDLLGVKLYLSSTMHEVPVFSTQHSYILLLKLNIIDLICSEI